MMEITREDRRSVIDHCYLAYFISGMVILIFGVILPNLIEERNLSFTAAGGLLSFLAIGNLCSSLVYPVFCGMMSQKMAVVVLAIPYPVCLLLFTFGLPVPVLYVMIFLIGITKGMITIINNHAIRQVTGSSNKYLNLLHMWYAVGAFLSPFVTMILMGAGMNWKTILQLLAVLTVLIVVSYATMDYRKIEKEEKKPAGEENGPASGQKDKLWFLKNTGFLLAVGALFFYMGLENSVNGWFVTYLKSTGFMSASLATVMVSVTWIMIMIGRIVIASISKNVPPAKILAVISVLQFASVLILVFAGNTAMAVAALVLLGLGGRIPDNDGLYRRSHGKFPAWNVGVYGDRFPRRDPDPAGDRSPCGQAGLPGGDHVPGAGRFPSGTFWRRSTPVRREKSQIG